MKKNVIDNLVYATLVETVGEDFVGEALGQIALDLVYFLIKG